MCVSVLFQLSGVPQCAHGWRGGRFWGESCGGGGVRASE